MSLSKIRTYLESQIKSVDADYKRHSDAFNTENVANLEKMFHIIYNVSSVAGGQQQVEQTLSITIKFYFKGYRDTVEMFDSAMDSVNDIASACASRTNMNAFRDTDNFPIQNVEMLSITPEQLADNDNAMTVDLELSADIFRSIC